MKAEHFTGAAFVAVLATVAAVEQDKLSLLPGFLLLAALVAAFDWGVCKMNQKGWKQKMTALEKKKNAMEYLEKIADPIAIERIYRFVYRQFIKSVDEGEKTRDGCN